MKETSKTIKNLNVLSKDAVVPRKEERKCQIAFHMKGIQINELVAHQGILIAFWSLHQIITNIPR
jgi:hypothetical protein